MRLINTLAHALVACLLLLSSNLVIAQCSTGGAPSYPSSCTSQYFTSITASGSGVTSTISYSGSSCAGSYFNYFSTQGIIATAGATVNMPITRVTGYAAYIAVYVDWNNNGTYELTELAGPTTYMSTGTGSTLYSFVVPVSGVTVGVNLHMRVFLGESGPSGASNPPCSASWGQSNDYYCKVVCPLPSMAVTPPLGSMCIGSPTGVTFTASGAGTGGTYTWSPITSLSATTGATVTATPSSTITYTVTGTDITGCVGTATATVTVNPLPTAVITPAAPSICAGGSVTLSTPSGTGYTYQWSAGGVPVPGATNATYIVSPATTTTYSVQTTTAAGCSATSTTITVTVNPLPIASVTPFGPVAICAGNSTTLTSTTGVGYTYQWYNTPTLIPGATNSTYNTSTAGDYYVTITGPGSCVSTSNTVNVTVNPVPTASITTSGPTTFCAGDSVTFTANSGTGYTYQWASAASGSIPGATNITYTTLTSGTYSVSVTNGFGCSAIAAATPVVVNPLPITSITVIGATSVCFPNSVSLNATLAAGYTYQWYKNTVLIPGATNANYPANTSGNYTVRIINTGTGCTATTSGAGIITVTIRPKPTASFTYSPSITRFCSYDSVTLTSPFTAGYTYEWLFNGLPIVGATNTSYAVHGSGNFKLVVFNGSGCSDTTSVGYTDTVDPAPSAAVTASGATAFCAGGNVTLNAASLPGFTYQWYTSPVLTGGSSISGATNSSYTASATAYYHTIVTSARGCITSSATISVTSVPPPVVAPGGPTTFCEGTNVALSVAAVPGAVYQWKRNSVNITGANASTYVATTTGYYSCYVNLPSVCASASPAVYVLVHPSPLPVVTFDGVRVRTGTSFVSYQWFMNTVLLPGATTYSTVVNNNASYRVLVTDTNGCSRLSDQYQVFNLGVDDINAAESIHIYPNPATDLVHIDMPAEMTIRITSVEGKTVFVAKNEKDINISNFPSGLYIVEITDSEGRRLLVEKLVKE